MNIRDSRIIRWLATAVLAMGTAWAGWVTKNINDLHAAQATISEQIGKMDGKLDTILDFVTNAHRK